MRLPFELVRCRLASFTEAIALLKSSRRPFASLAATTVCCAKLPHKPRSPPLRWLSLNQLVRQLPPFRRRIHRLNPPHFSPFSEQQTLPHTLPHLFLQPTSHALAFAAAVITAVHGQRPEREHTGSTASASCWAAICCVWVSKSCSARNADSIFSIPMRLVRNMA